MKRLVLAGLAVALSVSPAAAQVLLNDNFNNVNGGNSALNYAGFPNWTVTGNVDYLNNYPGLSCVGVPSGCVDLDGSGGPGYMRTVSSFSFNAGQTMRISFDLSGNQRNSADDQWSLALLFGGAPTISYSGSGGFAGNNGGPFANLSSVTFFRSISAGTPYANYTMDFLASTSGSVQYEIGTSSADNIGPLLDNVLIERFDAQTVVPEPSTWAMLAFGMGAMGVVARRRARKN